LFLGIDFKNWQSGGGCAMEHFEIETVSNHQVVGMYLGGSRGYEVS
jgi:hypothetical protein